MPTSTARANLQLLATAMIWGFAFVAQRLAMDHIEPFTFNAVRFALGALVLLPMLPREARRWRPDPGLPPLRDSTLAAGAAAAGTIIFVAAALQQTALVSTTATKAGFITGLYVVIVPIFGLLWRQQTGRGTWVGAGLAAVGLYLLSIRGDLTIARGDLLALIGAFGWAGHVCLMGWMSPRCRPLRVACIQFAVCATGSAIVAAARETIDPAGLRAAGWSILYAGLLSVGVAYTLQVVAQRRARPAHAAVIMSSEAVFALLGGWIVLHETVTGRGALGCGLMLAGMIVSQVGLPRMRRRNQER